MSGRGVGHPDVPQRHHRGIGGAGHRELHRRAPLRRRGRDDRHVAGDVSRYRLAGASRLFLQPRGAARPTPRQGDAESRPHGRGSGFRAADGARHRRQGCVAGGPALRERATATLEVARKRKANEGPIVCDATTAPLEVARKRGANEGAKRERLAAAASWGWICKVCAKRWQRPACATSIRGAHHVQTQPGRRCQNPRMA